MPAKTLIEVFSEAEARYLQICAKLERGGLGKNELANLQRQRKSLAKFLGIQEIQ